MQGVASDCYNGDMKRTLLTLLLGLYLFTPPLYALADDHAVVLMYHRFAEDRFPSTSVRLEQFKAHLDYLEENDYNLWPLSRLAKALEKEQAIPPRTVVITVDDAYRSVKEIAWPLLRERGWPMTVFVATGASNEGRSDVMSWEQMRKMQTDGLVEFANHSVNHPHLPRRQQGEDEQQRAERIRAEIVQAQEDLRQQLGVEPPMLFAYPYGEYDGTVAGIVEALGYMAFGQHSGVIGRHSDRRALPRYAMAESWATMERFTLRVRSLPMPLDDFAPWEPRIEQNNPPQLTLRFQRSGVAAHTNCFLGDGTALKVIERSATQLVVQSPRELGPGRSRYNCTAPAGEGRFYWFSQQWLNID